MSEQAAPAAIADVSARVVRRAAASRTTRLVYAAAFAWGVVYAATGVLVHESFDSTCYDLGNHVQALHNTAHGRILEATTSE